MANSFYKYTGTGALQNLPVPPYIDRTHIFVSINNVDTTGFSWVNDSTISLTAPLGSFVKVYRSTSPNARVTDYIDGVPLTEAALDNDSLQAFYLSQEQLDATQDALLVIGQPNFSAIADAIAANAALATAGASSATASAGTATTKASEAAASAATATTKAGEAAASASTATTQATNAATSAGTATTQAGIATTQASNAATSAGTATTQAANAAGSAAAAAASAAATNLPTSLTGKALNLLRVKADELGYEHRTPAQAKSDIISAGSIVAADLATAVKPLGTGQTRQNLTGSRVSGTNYTNSTGRTIKVRITAIISTGTNSIQYTVGGGTFYSPSTTGSNLTMVEFDVFDGETYNLSSSTLSSISSWWEIR